MYENGRRLNCHSRKKRHIREQKKRFLRNPFMGSANGMTYEQYLVTRDADDWERRWGPRSDKAYCERYWQACYLSGVRKTAKDATNCVLRRHWHEKLNNFMLLDEEDWDDFDCGMGQHNGYQKHFDYTWLIW